MALPVTITDSSREAVIDHLTNTFGTILYEHHEIHAGCTYRVELADEVGDGNSISVSFKTPVGKQLHIMYAIGTENASIFSLFENVETANGSSITARNANRNFPDASETLNLVKDATLTTTNATTLISHNVGYEANNPNKVVNGVLEARIEWVLKEDTFYAFELENTSGVANEMIIYLDWYEHTPETD